VNTNFPEIGGKCTETAKLWGKLKILKRSSEILADENREICLENVKLGKIFT